MLTLCDGKTLGMAFSIVRNHKSALTTIAPFIDPRGQPKYTGVAGMCINTFLISGNARNARCIVLTKPSTNPDGMGIRRVSTKKLVSICHGSVQRLAFPAMDRIGERPHNDIVVSLQRDSPRMGSACLVVYADDVTRRSHAGEPQLKAKWDEQAKLVNVRLSGVLALIPRFLV